MRRNRILLLMILLTLVTACQAEIAGPIPNYIEDPVYTSPHRRIPQSEHSLSGVISDVHLEVGKNSELLHIGNQDITDNSSLPAYEIAYSEKNMFIRVYARNVQSKLWQGKLEKYAGQSPLVEAMSWEMGENNLFTEFHLELREPIRYRTWYYVNTGFFTIEFTARHEN